MVLAGIVVAAFFAAALGLIEDLADPQTKLPSMVYWPLGSFAGTTYQKLAIIAAAVLAAGPFLIGLSWRINLLSLGEADAVTLGVSVKWLRWGIIGLVALLVAAQVAISGVGDGLDSLCPIAPGHLLGRITPGSCRHRRSLADFFCSRWMTSLEVSAMPKSPSDSSPLALARRFLLFYFIGTSRRDGRVNSDLVLARSVNYWHGV